MRETAWAAELAHCQKILGKGEADAAVDAKSADWKVATAAWMKKTRLCRNGWLAGKLRMGPESSVARYVSEFLNGRRPSVRAIFERLEKGGRR